MICFFYSRLAEEQTQTKFREAEAEVKSLTLRLNDLHSLLLEKDEKIFDVEGKTTPCIITFIATYFNMLFVKVVMMVDY